MTTAERPTAPGLTCARCERDLYPGLAHRTNDGWTHPNHCPTPTCKQCNNPISRMSRTGICRTCYDLNRRTNAKRIQIRERRRPCNRCGLPTTNKTRLCTDCRAVTKQLGEQETWVA